MKSSEKNVSSSCLLMIFQKINREMVGSEFIPSLCVALLFSSLALRGASCFLLRETELPKTYTNSITVVCCPIRTAKDRYNNESNLGESDLFASLP